MGSKDFSTAVQTRIRFGAFNTGFEFCLEQFQNNNWHQQPLPTEFSAQMNKHSRTSPDVQFKEFLLTKQKTRPRTDYEWIGKTI